MNRRDSLSPFWWLWLPIGLAVGLAVLGQFWAGFYRVWIGSEDRGVLELSHVLLPGAGFILAVTMQRLPALVGRPWLRLWLALAAVCCFYVAGEESSWGQHYFGWVTPEAWRAVNDQGETNLHNTSGWFDQKPRALLEIAIIVGGIILPLAGRRWPALLRHRLALVVPPLTCLPTALLVELVAWSERIPRAFGTRLFLFERTSEVQELFFYLFVVLYLVTLRQCLRALGQAPSRASSA